MPTLPHWKFIPPKNLRKRLSQPRFLWTLSLGWILAIAGLTLFWGIGDIGLIDETEPLFVEASRQMLLTGDWVTPYFDGETRFDKPPLIYWLMVLCFKLFGVSEWAARLPSAIAAVGIVVFCYWVLKNHHPLLSPIIGATNGAKNTYTFKRPWLAAWLGASALLLNLNTYFWGRTGYADMLLLACLGGALLAFFMGYAQPNPTLQGRWYTAFYGLTGLAILTKGPIALLLPVAIIFCFTLYLGNMRQVCQELRLLRGGLIVGALAVPWYVLVTIAHGDDFLGSFFGYHNLVRFSSVVNQHSGPWYFHFLVILAGFFPWSAYLPAALYRVKPWQRQRWQARSRSEQLGLYALIWFVVILGFFTVAVTKYFSYTLPLMPAAAILVSLLWTEDICDLPVPQSRWSLNGWNLNLWDLSRWFNVALLGVMAWALFSCAPWLSSDPWMPTLGSRMAAAGLPLMGGLVWALAAFAAVLCILLRRNSLWLVNAIAFLLFLVVFLHPTVSLVDEVRQLPLRDMAKAAIANQSPPAADQSEPQPEILMIGFRKPSLVFYTQQHVEYLEQPQQLQPYLNGSAAKSQLIITTPQLLAETGLQPAQYETIQNAGVYTLIRTPIRTPIHTPTRL
ncbi:MAG: glycosyltransferase family 39 protein [Thermosynechococcaceae cyanobacterium MS004]|nr:glycosyltransferase family 39 protein [Thermosynechococcaceae cyanobacterium MS004]